MLRDGMRVIHHSPYFRFVKGGRLVCRPSERSYFLRVSEFRVSSEVLLSIYGNERLLELRITDTHTHRGRYGDFCLQFCRSTFETSSIFLIYSLDGSYEGRMGLLQVGFETQSKKGEKKINFSSLFDIDITPRHPCTSI